MVYIVRLDERTLNERDLVVALYLTIKKTNFLEILTFN